MYKIEQQINPQFQTEFHPYDPNNPRVFQEVKQIIQRQLPEAHVEHFGSTSIPGVGGRGMMDMVIPADPADHEALIQQLYAIGFQDSPLTFFKPMLIGSICYQEKHYTLLLYLVTPDSEEYRWWLTFRDHLRSHPEEAQHYETVKQQALADGKVARPIYNDAKTLYTGPIRAELSAKSS